MGDRSSYRGSRRSEGPPPPSRSPRGWGSGRPRRPRSAPRGPPPAERDRWYRPRRRPRSPPPPPPHRPRRSRREYGGYRDGYRDRHRHPDDRGYDDRDYGHHRRRHGRGRYDDRDRDYQPQGTPPPAPHDPYYEEEYYDEEDDGTGGLRKRRSAEEEADQEASTTDTKKKRAPPVGGTKCKLHMVYCVNALVLCAGVAMIAMGAMDLKQHKEYENIMGIAYIGAMILVVGGCLTVVAAILGFIGAYKMSRLFLALNCMFLFLLFFLVMGSGGFIMYMKSNPGTVRKGMLKTMVLYREKPGIRKTWNDLQIRSSCCGIDDEKGVAQWRQVARDLMKQMGIKSWKDLPGISSIPGVKNATMPPEWLESMFPFMYPEDDPGGGSKSDGRRRRREADDMTSQIQKAMQGIFDTGSKLAELLVYVPVSCCLNPEAYNFNETTVPNTTCTYKKKTVKENYKQNGCLPKLMKKAFMLAIMSISLSVLLLVGIVFSAMVIASPDKFLYPQRKAGVAPAK